MHHFDAPTGETPRTSAGSWHRELTRYHWFVLIVAALGWLFDTMDQQLFVLARTPAMRELLKTSDAGVATEWGSYATSIFLVGWALGGLGFGALGDRIGRAKTMLLTILVYSMFTGLSAVSVTFWDFAAYRFLTGLGVGGEFAVGVALVAEVMPPRARPFALGLLQALSAVGNITAASISIWMARLQLDGVFDDWSVFGIALKAWRIMFVIGILPALLVIVIRRRLKEPERWQAISSEAILKRRGSYRALFGHPVWRRHTIIGLLLAFSGVVGLWAIGFFTPELTRGAFQERVQQPFRDKGEPVRDREFIQLALRFPEQAVQLKLKDAPWVLLGLEFKNNGDPTALFDAIGHLHKQGEPVSAASVLALLDEDEQPLKEEGKPSGQKPEARERRAKYLEPLGNLPGDAALAEHVQRIVQRSKQIEYELAFWAGINQVMLNLGAFVGIYGFAYVTHFTGRKPAFAVSFLAAIVSTAAVFWFLREFVQVFWMIPLMGICQLSLFGGYAIYFPELFPTHLRSTGTSFCYNVGRIVAAVGPPALGLLTSRVYTGPDAIRYAGVTMCVVFLVGLFALPFAPETKGKPLPEEK
ncbi:MAG: MFS transporter [Planctomycetia bacterium]|nr:MFS transporter [Planctomycetia bacterium]